MQNIARINSQILVTGFTEPEAIANSLLVSELQYTSSRLLDFCNNIQRSVVKGSCPVEVNLFHFELVSKCMKEKMTRGQSINWSA